MNSNQAVRAPTSAAGQAANLRGRLRPLLAAIPEPARLAPLAYSCADQAFAVGGGFLANVALARAQTKEEYGMFVLSYSLFTFFFGLYNAAIVEPYTVYGAGRYRGHFSEYLQMMVRINVILGMSLTGVLLAAYFLFLRVAPTLASRSLIGLALTVSVLLFSSFLRRAFYVLREPGLAARTSFVFFVTVAVGLLLAARLHALNGLSVFMILAVGWIAGGAAYGRKLLFTASRRPFLEIEPGYWREHWNYAQWALATASVFQFTTQGYYWLVAFFLSVKQVAELRATYLIVAPVEQAFVAISLIVLPGLCSHYAATLPGEYFSLWKRNVLGVAGLTGAFALCMRVMGKTAMHILYAGKFDGLAPLLYLLSLSPLFIGIAGTMVNGLISTERPKLVFWGYLSSGAATFLLGIPLVMHFGLRGAVYGILVSGSTLAVVLTCIFLLTVRKRSGATRGRVHAV